MLWREEFQELSEVEIFNVIGAYAESQKYNPLYFKVAHSKEVDEELNDTVIKYMHYIHLYKDEELVISIYFDEHNLGMMYPEFKYYELYHKGNVERFLKTNEDEIRLFDKVIKLI